jgi:hypothetical protein
LEDNIRKDLREIDWAVVDWIHLDQDRDKWQAVMNMITNLQGLFRFSDWAQEDKRF